MGQDESKQTQLRSKTADNEEESNNDDYAYTSASRPVVVSSGTRPVVHRHSTSDSIVGKLFSRIKPSKTAANVSNDHEPLIVRLNNLATPRHLLVSPANSKNMHLLRTLSSTPVDQMMQTVVSFVDDSATVVAAKQNKISSRLMDYQERCALAVVSTAQLLQLLHSLSTKARVVSSLQEELNLTQYSLEQLLKQAEQLDTQLAALEGASCVATSSSGMIGEGSVGGGGGADDIYALGTTTTTPRRRRLSVLKSANTRLLWESEAVASLYINPPLNEEVRTVWRENLIPEWPTKQGLVRSRIYWFNGVPPEYRRVVWRLAVGNRLCVTAAQYKELCSTLHERTHLDELARERYRSEYQSVVRSEKLRNSAPESIEEPLETDQSIANISLSTATLVKPQEPTDVTKTPSTSATRMIAVDLPRTFPEFHLFDQVEDESSAGSQLQRILLAVSLLHEDIGYVQGMSHVAGLLLLYMGEEDSFVAFANLVERHFFRALFAVDLNAIELHLENYQRFLAERLPDVERHFQQLNVSAVQYLLGWLMTLFSKSMPHRCAARVMDCFLMEGESFLYRTAVAILSLHKRRLLEADMENVLHLLRDLPRDLHDESVLFEALESVAPMTQIVEAEQAIEEHHQQQRILMKRNQIKTENPL